MVRSNIANRVGRVLFVALLAVAAVAVGPAAHASITVHLWSMDEPAGSGTMLDSGSPTQTFGSWENISAGIAGVTGTAYHFNGSSSRIVVNDDPSLDPGSSPFSVTVHVRFTEIPTTEIGGDFDLIRKGLGSTSGGDWKVEIVPTSNGQQTMGLCHVQGSAGVAEAKGAQSTLDDGTWHELSCSKDDDGVILTVDGTSYVTDDDVGSVANSAPLTVGAKNIGGDWYDGDMDDVSLQIGATNSAPEAGDVAGSTTRNLATSVSLTGEDADSCELTFSVPAGSSKGGSVSGVTDDTCVPGSPNLDTAEVTYMPRADFVGKDSFTYKVYDGVFKESNLATVTIRVRSPISLRDSRSAANAGDTTLLIPAPSAAQPGDVLLAEVAVRDTPVITPPEGWVLLRSDLTRAQTQSVYYRIATGAEPTSYTWTFSEAVTAAGGILDYGGVDSSNPIDVYDGRANGKSTSLTAPSITTTRTGDAVIAFFDITRNNTVEPPASMTERFDGASNTVVPYITVECADQIKAKAGATGTRIATASLAGVSIGQLVALRPA
ncbi:MAG: LamG domain-containing protein [Actinomycetota bacterium]|nr:LamG domain-containing protein [Actinomycetota bacterium]